MCIMVEDLSHENEMRLAIDNHFADTVSEYSFAG